MDTDCGQILQLYDQLMSMAPTAVVALNRAVVLAEVEDPQTPIETIEDLDLDDYYLLHAARADLLRRLERMDEAARADRAAEALTSNEIERRSLNSRRASFDLSPRWATSKAAQPHTAVTAPHRPATEARHRPASDPGPAGAVATWCAERPPAPGGA